MKLLTTLFFAFFLSIGYSQTLPIDFESDVTTSDFIDFDGGTATVIANPQSNGINTSATVAQIVRDGGEIWSGSKVALDANLDFSEDNLISMKVFCTSPIGTIVKFKLEGDGAIERDQPTTVSGEWETLTWDFSGAPANFNEVVFMFDFGNVGDGSMTSTFLFDDVQRSSGGVQIDLPVDFEGDVINYSMTDFGDNQSSLVVDPTDSENMVIRVIKPDFAAEWAGTTIGTPAGFATDIPLTLTDSKMNVRIWSPEAGTPIRLKVEDSNDPTHTCETEVNTTLSGEWEVMEFDFTNQAPGTAELSVGLSMGWTFNMASLFFNFGTDGATAGENTYYFDDVMFGAATVGLNAVEEIEGLSISPNPAVNEWNITIEGGQITTLEIFNLQGKLIQSIGVNSSSTRIDASEFASGTYVAQITSDARRSSILLVKE